MSACSREDTSKTVKLRTRAALTHDHEGRSGIRLEQTTFDRRSPIREDPPIAVIHLSKHELDMLASDMRRWELLSCCKDREIDSAENIDRIVSDLRRLSDIYHLSFNDVKRFLLDLCSRREIKAHHESQKHR